VVPIRNGDNSRPDVSAGLELERKGAREEGGSSKKGPIRREAPAANVDEDPTYVPRCIAASAVRLIDCRVGAERAARRSSASRRAKHHSASSRGDSTGRRRHGDERASSQDAGLEENPGRQQTERMRNVTFDDDLERAMTDTDLSADRELGRAFASLNKPSATIKRRPVGSNDPKVMEKDDAEAKEGGRGGTCRPSRRPSDEARQGASLCVALRGSRAGTGSCSWTSAVNEILHDAAAGGGGGGADDDERRALELTPAAPNPERSCRSAYDRSIGG
jgi:hypothetical protein